MKHITIAEFLDGLEPTKEEKKRVSRDGGNPLNPMDHRYDLKTSNWEFLYHVQSWVPVAGGGKGGWVETLNDHPATTIECMEIIKDHRKRLQRKDMIKAIVDSIYGACDNGNDMYELDNDYIDQYAVGSISMEIAHRDKSGLQVGDDYMDAGGYVSQHMEYRRMEGLPTYSREDLRPHLGAGILAFIDDPGRRE